MENNKPNFQRHFDRGAERATQVADRAAEQTAAVVENKVANKCVVTKAVEKVKKLPKGVKIGGGAALAVGAVLVVDKLTGSHLTKGIARLFSGKKAKKSEQPEQKPAENGTENK